MSIKRGSLVQQRQAPLRDRYRKSPAEACIRDSAQTVNACGGDAFHGAVVPANGGGDPLHFGIHRAVGGDHDRPNPGDLLCSALAACLDSTLRMLADHLGIRLQSLEIEVNAECDVRGCLLVERTVPVGFQQMHCGVRLRPLDEIDEDKVRMLIAAAESSCVVLQTLRNGVSVQTRLIKPGDASAESSAAAGAIAG
jgi:uncharacterized OsmC-like protein